ncbi:hypothetical protein SK128_002469, partial [Halocaridina rubra]
MKDIVYVLYLDMRQAKLEKSTIYSVDSFKSWWQVILDDMGDSHSEDDEHGWALTDLYLMLLSD